MPLPTQEWFAKVLREGEALSVTGKEHFASCEDVCALQLKLMLRKHQSSLSTEQLGNAVSTVMGTYTLPFSAEEVHKRSFH